MYVERFRLWTTFSTSTGLSAKVFSEAHPRERGQARPRKTMGTRNGKAFVSNELEDQRTQGMIWS